MTEASRFQSVKLDILIAREMHCVLEQQEHGQSDTTTQGLSLDTVVFRKSLCILIATT